MNAKQIWQSTIERLKIRVSTAVFKTWFQGTSALSLQDGVLIIRVPSAFVKAHLEGRFLETIRTILSDVAGSPVEIQFVVGENAFTEPATSSAPTEEISVSTPKRTYRIPKGRFSSAIRDKRLSDAAAMTSMAPAIPQTTAFRSKKGETALPEAEAEQQSIPPPVVHEPVAPQLPPKVQGYTPTLPNGPSFEGLLNPRYTFGSFIVGKSNQLAHATSFAVSENPGHVYNPLFLYGGVGLGKTHLLHAIGHSGETAGLNVLYVTSEKFTNEIINAIRFQKTDEFRAKYRQIDILLVDDIQFIAGKESTEEEFFHTFNTLHNANKQIVVTSDRPPKAISSLQDRLRSRFEWGLLADVQPPEYEHRLAILRSKSESLRFTVPTGVVEYIARPECRSVRELEGALNRVIAYATLHDAPLTAGLAAQALEHIYDKKVASNLTITDVLDGICRYYNVEASLLRGKQRDRDIVWPRQVAMYLMREETNASLLQIGGALGGRDHTTIMHGWEKVHAEIASNDEVRQEIATVLDALHHRQF